MKTKFQIGIEKNNGNLHVRPRGDFDGNSAWELVHTLDEAYSGEGNVIIDTKLLNEICPFGCETLQCRIDQSRIPRDRFLFTGEKGPVLAPEGCRIFVAGQAHECRCSGNCAECKCRRQKPN
jgi:hypothetical protein